MKVLHPVSTFTLASFALAVATVAQQTPPTQDPSGVQRVTPYDPNLNMGTDGTSVLKPDIPADVPNPDRWRYTPGGRIKPGNVLDRFLVTTFIAPIFFREEDIGFGAGFALTDIDFRNQDWREFANIVASYSEEGQQAMQVNWRRWLNHRPIAEGGIIRDERSRISASAGYQRTLTRRFYGFGSRTGEAAETSYTEEFGSVGAGFVVSVPRAGDDLIVGADVHLEHHGLQRGRVTGIPSTDDVFGAAFQDGDGVDQLWVSGSAAYDTRDSISNPYRGWRVGLGAAIVPLQTGLNTGARFSLDSSAAFPVPPLFHDGGDARDDNPPTDVFALGGFVVSTAGDLPFYSQPALGGDDTLRGYIQRRFTDRVAAHASAEYRFAVVPRGFRITDTIRVERVNLALFYDIGTVADDLGNLDAARWRDSYGVGVRLGFAREATFRVDLGFSEEDTLLTIAFGNTF